MSDKGTLVEIRAIEVKKWHGKTGSENFFQPDILECLYDKKTGKYATGLSKEDKERLEGATGYDLSDAYSDKPHPFWSTKAATLRLTAQTIILDIKVPLNEIKVKMAKASKYVANSLREFEEGLYPDATHVIFDEKEEMELKASKIQRKNKAVLLSVKMSTDEKANVIQIMSGKSMRSQSQNFLDVEIANIIEDDVEGFTMWAKADSGDVYIRAAVLEGIHRNILTKEGNVILYMGDRIGHSLDEAVSYFADPNNQAIKASILEKLTI